MQASEVVVQASDIGQQWLGIPAVEVTSKGRVFVAWFSGGTREPAYENTVYLNYRDAGATSFSQPCVVAAPDQGARVYDPTLWLDPEGVLWLIYNRGNKDTAEHGIFARTCSDPDAPTPLWSEPRQIIIPVPYAFRLNKPTVLSTGEWLMPVTWSSERVASWFASGTELQGVAISYDKGVLWKLYGAVKAPRWALENMIVERASGGVVMYIRTGSGVMWQSESYDRGMTWGEGRPTTIPNPGSRFFVCKLASGRWLLINSPDPKERISIVACLSSDEGRTWGRPVVLDARSHVSYPDAAQASDGTIYAVYDRDRLGVGEILLVAFKEEDLL